MTTTTTQDPIKSAADARVPTCPACFDLGRGPMIDPTDFTVETHAKVSDFDRYSFAEDNRDTHHVGDLAAMYDLGSARVACHFPDHTPHGVGFVIVTRCCKLLRIGKDCAHRYIVDVERLLARVADARRLQASRGILRDAPEDMAHRLAGTTMAVRACDNFRAKLRLGRPDLQREIDVRRLARGGRRLEVLIPAPPLTDAERADGKKQQPGRVDRLEGMGIFFEAQLSSAEHARLVADVDCFAEEIREAVRTQGVVDAAAITNIATIRSLDARRTKLQPEVDRFVNLVAEAERFFTEGNMKLLSFAATGSVTEDTTGATYRVKGADGKPYRLGRDGMRPIN